jgi:hypothetical protein
VIANHAGTENTGKVLILQGGKATQLAKGALDLDYVKGRDQARENNLAIHAVAPIAAGISEAGTQSAYYAALLQTTELACQPEFNLVAASFTHHLGKRYGDDIVVTMDARAINDPQMDQAKASLLAQHKAGTINEFRRLLGFGPIKNGEKMIGEADQQPGGMPGMTAPGGGPDATGGLPGMPQADPEQHDEGDPDQEAQDAIGDPDDEDSTGMSGDDIDELKGLLGL